MEQYRRLMLAFFALSALPIGNTPAKAQAFPPGSYQSSCTQIHWGGTTLIAECRKRGGGMSGTGLADAAHCKGDIANVDGQLRCTGGASPRAAAPVLAAPPPPDYAPREPNYPAPGYPEYREPRDGGYGERREHCEHIRARRDELRERMEYAPGYDRERIEHRLRELHEEEERLGCWR